MEPPCEGWPVGVGAAKPGPAAPAGRDAYVDFVRGLLLLSVIHIHTVYWSLLTYIPDGVRHAAYLVDIPIFFFISGYLFKNPSFLGALRSAWRQFSRLYLQYLAVTFLAAGGILLWLRFGESRTEPQVGAVLFSVFTLDLQGRMWGYLKMYEGNLWYARTYLSLLALVPLLAGPSFFRKRLGLVLAFAFAGYVLTTYHYPAKTFLLVPAGQVLFYALFFLLGALVRAREAKIRRRDVVLSLALNLVLAGLVFHADGNRLILSPAKFPPTVPYFVYALPLVHVFLLGKWFWRRAKWPGMAPIVWAGRHSFVVYLVQGAVCSLPFFFVRHLGTENPWALYALVFSFNVAVSFALSGLYVSAAAFAKRGWSAAGRRLGGKPAPAGR
ncbi:MAG: acyltransferase family protein [Kiritimatiellia bacterium]